MLPLHIGFCVSFSVIPTTDAQGYDGKQEASEQPDYTLIHYVPFEAAAHQQEHHLKYHNTH